MQWKLSIQQQALPAGREGNGRWRMNRALRVILMLTLLMGGFHSGGALSAGTEPPPPPQAEEVIAPPGNPPDRLPEPIETKHALIICGHPGDDEHRVMYADVVERLHKALTTHHRFAAERVWVLFGAETTNDDGPALQSARGKSTQENIRAAVAGLHKALTPEDTLWVIVLGHAHYDGRHSFFNLPGPDVHEEQFASLFDGLTAREQVFLITIPASGFSIRPLSTKGRIVITATEANLEVNETIFPLALADVLEQPLNLEQHDADRDGVLSVFDLYIAVARQVASQYADDELIATEHAQLDDNGDGRGTELQIDYLPPEQGGRPEGDPKASIGPSSDGALSMRTRLHITPASAVATGGETGGETDAAPGEH